MVNLTNQSNLTRLRGHDGDIQSCLFTQNYLVSSSKLWVLYKLYNTKFSGDFISEPMVKDKQIKVWENLPSLTSEEKCSCIRTIRLPKASGYKGKRQSDDSRSWISLASLPAQSFGSDDFISSGNGGDIILWRLESNPVNEAGDEKNDKIWKNSIFCESQTDLTHQRVVFGFAVVGNLLISTSMDREIKAWDLITRKPLHSFTTNGGFIYSAARSPVEGGPIAYGVGDGMFR